MTNHALLDSNSHRELRVRVDTGVDLGDGVMATLTVPTEFRRVQGHFPILFRREAGQERIFARIRELQRHTAAEMRSKVGWTARSPEVGPLLGPLMAFELPERLQSVNYGVMFELLEKKGIQISIVSIGGRYCMRLSPHIYSTEAEISRAAETIAATYGRE